jgi:hypothetical protein
VCAGCCRGANGSPCTGDRNQRAGRYTGADLPPTETALPSLTATFTETALPTVTLTPSADYAAIEIKGLTNNANGVDVVAVIPGISGAYDLQLGGIPYACATDAGYPDRLFCKGLSKPALDTDISVVLTASADSQVVYSGRITIPSGMFATQVPDYYTDNYCAQRGQNVSCETECRIAPTATPALSPPAWMPAALILPWILARIWK